MIDREDLKTVREIAVRLRRHPHTIEAFRDAHDIPIYRFPPDRRRYACLYDIQAAAKASRVNGKHL